MKQTLRKTSALLLLGTALSFGARGQTYCTPVNGGDCSQQIINQFTIDGTTLNNMSGCTEGAKYTFYPPGAGTTALLTPGQTYTLTLGSGSNGNPAQFGMWIDYDQNGTFDASEFHFLSASLPSPGTGTATFTVPATATPGTTRLRVRSNWQDSPPMTDMDACTFLDYGETEDYEITLGTLTPCSGTPAAGITSSATSVCAGTPFSLSATPTGLSGVTYLFQSSTDGGTIWGDLGTASATAFYLVPTQSVTTEYRVIVTCGAGGADTSAPVTVAQNPGTSCYCTPVYTWGCSSDNIDGVVINGEAGTAINHTGTGCSPGAYGDFTSMSVSLFQGFSYPGVITTTYSDPWEFYRIWIDFNDNGLFENSESLAFGGPISIDDPGNFTLNIPATAPAGVHRMRVRLVYNTDAATIDPCITYNWGETHDYNVNIIVPEPCTGISDAMVVSSASAVCPDAPFTLTATPSDSTGYTFQFQSSTDGGAAWTNLGTASSSSMYTVPTQTVTTQYRVIISCSAGGIDTSAAVTVTQNPPTSCYCTPIYVTGCTSSDRITNFELGTIANNTGSACSVLPKGYSDFTSMSTNLAQGVSYVASVSIDFGGDAGVAIWIDYNDNGLFEPTEKYYTSGMFASGSTGTINMDVPATAALGAHRMRVRLVYYNEAEFIDPCSSYTYGETEDYMVNIIYDPCTGIPDAVVSAAVTTTCAETPFNLTATPAGLSGFTYQFQVSTDGGTVWDNLGTASSVSYYTVPTQTTASQYRVIVTCAAGGTDTSAAVSVAQSPYTDCYCTPGETYTWDNYITNVSFTSINNPSGPAPMGYDDYTSIVPAAELTTGMTYPITVDLYNPAFWGGAAVAAWIDFDHSGTFDADEFFDLAPGYSSLTTVTGNITVDPAALAGPTRMRIRTQFMSDLLPTDGCNDLPAGFNEGETEDYAINISIAAPCTGIPAATISATDTTVCAATPFMLMAGPTGLSGLTFQYQVSTDGGTTWTNLGTPTAYTFYNVPSQDETSQYRVIVSCAAGGTDTSAAVNVAQNPATECYCIPVYTYDCSSDDLIDNFMLTGEDGSEINQIATGCSPGNYADYTDSVVMVLAGNTYNGSLTTIYSSNEYVSIWGDFNQNGAFEPTEQLTTYGPFGGGDLVNFSITIPAGTPNGSYRMRVRLTYNEPFMDPCATYNYGETHDYTLQVGPPCSLTVDLGADTAICTDVPLTLDAGIPGATYLWSTGDNTQTIPVNAADTYWVTVTESGCTAMDTIVISTIPAPSAGTIDYTNTAANYTFSASGYSTGGTYSWNYGDGTTGAGVTTVHTYTANGNYEVMFIATNSCGQSDTATTMITVSGLDVSSVAGQPSSVQVYPNPSRGLTVVEAQGAVISSVEVMDNLGRMVLRSQPDAAKAVIDVKGMAQGIYTLRIQTNKGISTVKLVVKD